MNDLEINLYGEFFFSPRKLFAVGIRINNSHLSYMDCRYVSYGHKLFGILSLRNMADSVEQ